MPHAAANMLVVVIRRVRHKNKDIRVEDPKTLNPKKLLNYVVQRDGEEQE